jgi:uncharacterized protein
VPRSAVRVDVELPGAKGTTLRGWLHLPDGRGPWPGIVLTHGFSATRSMGLDRWGDLLAGAGFVALVYDHRGFGDSDGEPRQVVDPWAQTRDLQLALTWLSGRPEVDPDRLALWGTSYSAGEALVLGAIDPRVRAVVATVPFAALPTSFEGDTMATLGAMRAQLADEHDDGGTPMGPFAVADEEGVDLPVFLGGEEAAAWFGELGGAPGSGWQNRVWFGGSGDVTWDPGAAVAHLSPTPLLMVVATDDTIAATEVSLRAFERAGEPKQLELVEGGHFSAYDGAGFEKASGATVAFLRRWL